MTVEKSIFDFFKKGMYGNCCVKNCNGKTINSHSIPKAILKKEKKLYQIHHDNLRDYNPLFQNVTNNSGMFYNFLCNDHDAEIFKDIENSGKINNYSDKEQKFLFCLKALFYSLSYCNNFFIYHREKIIKQELEKDLELMHYILKNGQDIEDHTTLIHKIKQKYGKEAKDLEEQMKNENFSFGGYIGEKILKNLSPSEIKSKLTNQEYLAFILDLYKSYKEKKFFEDFIDMIFKTNKGYLLNLELKEKNEKLLIELGIGEKIGKSLFIKKEIYDKENYSKIKTKIYKISDKLPVFSNSVIFQYTSFQNSDNNMVINSTNTIFFSLFCDDNQTVCLISYFKENKKFDSLMSEIISEERIKDIIFNLSMLGNNVVFTEEFKKKLGNKENEFLKDYSNFQFQKDNYIYEHIFSADKRKKYKIF